VFLFSPRQCYLNNYCFYAIMKSMFGDSHFHLSYLDSYGIDTVSMMQSLAKSKIPYLLDIGTHCDDLSKRAALSDDIVSSIALSDADLAEHVQKTLFFASGIWPAPEAIADRFTQMAELEHQIQAFKKDGFRHFKGSSLIAVGECGLDHHWNIDGPDNRDKNAFSASLLHGEAEMFEMHLNLAKNLDLPIIVHSRDAFDGTLACIKNCGYHKGIIHCYSYGIEEARSFIDLGWYISFSGSVTYAKRSKIESVYEMLRFVPKDRLLLETDAPYLAPVPNRGKTNTPLFIKDTYSFVSQALCMDSVSAAQMVLQNFNTLFGLN